jgi:hypothetical protein
MLPPPTLVLPDPALDPGDGSSAHRSSPDAGEATTLRGSSQAGALTGRVELLNPAIEAKGETPHIVGMTPATNNRRLFKCRRRASSPDASPLSLPPHAAGVAAIPQSLKGFTPGHRDLALGAYREFDLRQTQFFAWMDSELQKIETFYKAKEDEANHRLRILKEQLLEMRERRIEEAWLTKHAAEWTRRRPQPDKVQPQPVALPCKAADGHRDSSQWLQSFAQVWPQARSGHGSIPAALQPDATPARRPRYAPDWHAHTDNRRDFERRRRSSDSVPYRQAKRKLKAALAEYYRGLELLKSYALLNRTAFRKMNKKYDKLVHAYPGGRYVAERVNKAWFVQSAVLDTNMRTVEDLYSKYFEQGNHKVAVGKLKTKSSRANEYHGSVFRNGFCLAAGTILGVQGVAAGAKLLFHYDPTIQVRSAYLLQVSGLPIHLFTSH